MNCKIFNSSTELGLRCLFILNATGFIGCSLEKILYLDHLSIYANKIKDEAINLHPDSPYQVIEVIEKRKNIEKAIKSLVFKGLIDIEFEQGIYYRANANTKWVVSSFEDKYCEQLKKNIELIVSICGSKSEEELKNIVWRSESEQREKFSEFYPFIEEV